MVCLNSDDYANLYHFNAWYNHSSKSSPSNQPKLTFTLFELSPFPKHISIDEITVDQVLFANIHGFFSELKSNACTYILNDL